MKNSMVMFIFPVFDRKYFRPNLEPSNLERVNKLPKFNDAEQLLTSIVFKCFSKYLLLKTSQYLQENICVGVS